MDVVSATKTAVCSQYRENEKITYVISIVNCGTCSLSGVCITDDLGEYTYESASAVPLTYVDDSVRYYINGVLQPTPAVSCSGDLEIGPMTVPAGGNVTVIYETLVNQFAPLETDGCIVNTATISGGGLTSLITASETVNAESCSSLNITKSVYPSTVLENGELTYTFVIQNNGNADADADANAYITDTFAPILDITSVTFNGSAWTSPANYTYDTATGAFTTIPGQITVPAATFTRDAATGQCVVTPGVSTLTVTGTI